MMNMLRKIANFPTKVNTITLVLTLVLYTVTLAAVAEVAPPNNDYVLEPKYSEAFYNEEVNSWVKIVGHIRQKTINQGTDTEETILVPRYTINTYASGNNGNDTSSYHFHYAAIYGDGKLKYFPSTKHTGKTHNYQMLTLQEVGGSQVNTIFGRLSYLLDGERKETSFRSDLLTLSSREMRSSKFKDVLEMEDLFTIQITLRENAVNTDRYNNTIRVTIKNPTTPYNFSMQTWLVTEDGELFQHLGVYNFHTSLGVFSSYNNETIFKYVKPAYLYLKAVHVNENGQTEELWYKTPIQALLDAN